MNNGYISFVNDCLEEIKDQDKKNYIFKLKRYNKETPFWCIFFCDRSTPEISQILGSHILDAEEKVDTSLLLTILADSGVFTKVSSRYFITGSNENEVY